MPRKTKHVILPDWFAFSCVKPLEDPQMAEAHEGPTITFALANPSP